MKDSIDIPIACIKRRKDGHHVTECGKKEKAKKEKDKKEEIRKKQDRVDIDIKPITLQNLMTKAKMVKQEIKEDNSSDIDEQNIAEIINLKELSKHMIDSPSLAKMLTIDRIPWV